MLFSRLSFARPRLLLKSLALRSRPALRFALPVAGALPLLAVPALAKPSSKLTGVQAWTSGSQTYLRVRPSQSTPIVAKVAKHTPLYVWGKYQGWYRVQTHDDIFGWVHYDLINSPALGKVKELSHAEARRAAVRGADQTMYGTPQQLKTYYKKHGAVGAIKGLREMGVPISIGSKPKAKTVAAKPVVKKAVVKKVVAVAKPKAVTTVRVSAPKTVVRKAAPKTVAAPRVMTPARKIAVSNAPVIRRVVKPKVVVSAPKPVAKAPVKVLAPAPPAKIAAPKKVSTTTKKASPRAIAKAKGREQLRAKMGMTNATPPLPIGDIAPVSPEELMKARRAYLEARKQKAQDSAPARETTPANDGELGGAKVTPSSYDSGLDADGWAPFNTNGWSARASMATNATWNANRAPGFRLITEEVEAATLGDKGLDDDELRRWKSLPALETLIPQTRANAQRKPAAAATPSRGGSPRDRYKNQNGDFRQTMANQALSYRGRPYVFGSASPSRGFDCSGLIYFLLRQRGYNPPRTAAGYKNYGTAVARGQWQPGDLMLFANTYKHGISHIGIYLGNNNFVHAASTRQGVRVDSMNTKYYASKYYSARRVPGK